MCSDEWIFVRDRFCVGWDGQKGLSLPLDDLHRRAELEAQASHQCLFILKILVLIATEIPDPVGVVLKAKFIQI